MSGRRFLPSSWRSRFGKAAVFLDTGWVFLASAALLAAPSCGFCGGQTGDCFGASSASAPTLGVPATGGAANGSASSAATGGRNMLASEPCGTSHPLELAQPSEDGFTAGAMVEAFAGRYVGTVGSADRSAGAAGAASAGSQVAAMGSVNEAGRVASMGVLNEAGTGGAAGAVNEAEKVVSTGTVADAGAGGAAAAVGEGEEAFWESIGLEAPAGSAEAVVTLSYRDGAVNEVTCSRQVQIQVEVGFTLGGLEERSAVTWLVGDTESASLAVSLTDTRSASAAGTAEDAVAAAAAGADGKAFAHPALLLELAFDGAGANGTLSVVDADAARPSMPLTLSRQ